MVTRREAAAFLGFGLAAAWVRPARAAGGTAPFDDWTSLDALFEEARSALRVPGFAIAIVRDGAVAYARGFGRRDGAASLPVTPDTLFRCASTTKAFTAASAALLVAEGRLDWDEPVRTYLPGFRMAGGAEYDAIALRDMLSHRTGLARHDLVWSNAPDLTREILLERLPHLAVAAPPRAKHLYNNLMFMLAGHAVERVAGVAWEDVVRTRIFEPLGMARSNLSTDAMGRDGDHAVGHALDDAREAAPIPLRPADAIGPAGAVNSTVRDMAEWIRLQLGQGAIGSIRLWGPAEAEAMHEPLIGAGGKPDFPEFGRGFYGLGWRVDSYRGRLRVAHGGNLNGFSSRVTLLPDDGIGIVAFANLRGSPLPGHATHDAIDRLLGLEPRDWSRSQIARRDKREAAADAAETAAAAAPKDAPPSRPLDAFAGLYRHPGYGDLAVETKDGALRAIYNAMPARLVPWRYDVFKSEPERPEQDDDMADLRFGFREDLRGRVDAVLVDMEPTVAPIAFLRRPDPRLSDPAVLAAFAGTYRAIDRDYVVALAGPVLTLATGSDVETLKPDIDGSFAIADDPSASVRFIEIEGRVAGLQIIRSDGIYEAARL